MEQRFVRHLVSTRCPANQKEATQPSQATCQPPTKLGPLALHSSQLLATTGGAIYGQLRCGHGLGGFSLEVSSKIVELQIKQLVKTWTVPVKWGHRNCGETHGETHGSTEILGNFSGNKNSIAMNGARDRASKPLALASVSYC